MFWGHIPAARNRTALIGQVVEQARQHTAAAHRLYEAARLTPEQVREWLAEAAPELPPEAHTRLLQLLTASLEPGELIPAQQVVSLLTIGLPRFWRNCARLNTAVRARA